MLSKFKPATLIQELAAASVALSFVGYAAAAVHPDAGLASGGIALGVWLSALYAWIREPFSC